MLLDKRDIIREYAQAKLPGFGDQNVHTPFDLCYEIVSKLSEYTNPKECFILVLFNVEWIPVLIEDFGVNPEKITFVADSAKKRKLAKLYNVQDIRQIDILGRKEISIMPKIKKQFDVVVMNPPYQANKNLKNEGGKKKGTRGGSLWDKFVKLSLRLVRDDGFVVNVHPPSWRKPEHQLLSEMTEYDIKYLEMHSERDGQSMFGASTSYDWYVLQKSPNEGKTEIVDQSGKRFRGDLAGSVCIPNWAGDVFHSVLARDGEETCEVLHSYSDYETRQPWMTKDKSGRHKYPCIHEMNAEGIGYWFSSRKGPFVGQSKVVLSFGRHQYPVNDYKGEYGMTQIVFGLTIGSKREGDQIIKAVNSPKFQEILKATKWSSFQTEWRMFKYFRKDFWKEFV